MCGVVSNDAELSKNPVDGFSIGLSDDDNIYEWKVMMEGPSGTPLYVASDRHVM